MLEFNFQFEVPGKGMRRARGSFEPHTRLAILGPSGCGKTTFLKALGGLGPKSGACTWMGKALDAELLKDGVLGFCFQSSPLFSHLDVLQNLVLPLQTLRPFRNLSDELRTTRAMDWLSRAGLQDLAHRPVQNLSGGERKRISLLRSLIFGAPILILDEPFADLDSANRKLFGQWLVEILAGHKGLLIFVTHQESDLQGLANQRFDWPLHDTSIDFGRSQVL